jgi:hypothetical protein
MDIEKMSKWLRQRQVQQKLAEANAAYVDRDALETILFHAKEVHGDLMYRFEYEGIEYVNSPTAGSHCWECEGGLRQDTVEQEVAFLADMAHLKRAIDKVQKMLKGDTDE